jgi:hypothetical protein
VIIGRLVSHPDIGLARRGRTLTRGLAATSFALWMIAMASIAALAYALPDSTWVATGSLPHQGRTAIFALAVDPSNNQALLAGNSEGSLLKSANAGATWTVVHAGKSVATTIAYSQYTSGLVLAGTRGGGAFISRDGGTTWSSAVGLEGRIVHVFAFSLTSVAAGTDKGVYISTDGGSWSQSALSNRSIDAMAVEAIHTPVRLVAGSDAQVSGSLPLYQSLDSGASWTTLGPPIAGATIVKLATGPLPPTGNVRPLVVGTNTGLFLSSDNGANFAPLSGGALLPTTDYTQVAFITDHFDRFYAASDGGGSKSGGLWRTDDGGQSFRSLQPPQPSVTALAVSSDEDPVLYVAIFQPSTHVASLWVYHDTGGSPQGPDSSQTAVASAARSAHPSSTSALQQILDAPQLPYIGLGVGALIVVLTAVVAHARSRYR